MNTKNQQATVPKALQSVWGWKQASYEEHKHLPPQEALSRIMREADRAARKLGFHPIAERLGEPEVLAEKPPPFKTRKQ